MASLSVHMFDRALAYDFLYILLFFLKKKKKKIGGEFADFFFLGLLDIACILT